MLTVFVFISLAIGSIAKEHIPVIIWGDYGHLDSEIHVPSLSKIRTYAFSHILHNLVKHRPHILLFAEENLSIEDFSWYEDDMPTFPYLRNLSITSQDFLYLPSVESPVNGFHQLTHHGYAFTNFDEQSPPTVSSPSIFKVNLREPEPMESRVSFLNGHDSDIERITTEAIEKYKKVLCAYTGRHASFVEPVLSRRRREVDEEEPDEIIMNDNNKTVYIVTTAPIELRKDGNVTYLTEVAYVSKDIKGDTIVLDVKFKEDTISLDFSFVAGINQAWTLESVEVEGTNVKMTSKETIGAPYRFSYFCAQNTTFKGVSLDGEQFTLIFQNLQAQPRVENAIFGQASDCVPYFSAQIWSGLLVSFFLMAVALMSILFILDIHTNDRFDDPKGKTITISNVE